MGKGSEKWPMDTIKKTLIAGVLIQASRFLLAALVDVSTIATYAVGGLPLSVIKNTDIGKQKILKVNSLIDLDKFSAFTKGEGFDVRYTAKYKDKELKISSCRVEKSRVIGREMMEPEYINVDKFDGDYAGYEICALFGKQLVMREEPKFMEQIATNISSAGLNADDYDNSPGDYKKFMNALIGTSWWNEQYANWMSPLIVNLETWWMSGIALGTKLFTGNDLIWTTISNLINKSKWFVGPLVTMYASLLNFAELSDTSVTNAWETSWIFIIKTGIAIALFFPLLALAVVLIARIGILWLYIAASPFLILKQVFGDIMPKLWEKLDEHLKLSNVISLIFAPVVTVAALSISLIFMTALINGFKSGDSQQMSSDLAQNLTMEQVPNKKNTFEVWWAVELTFTQFDRWGTLDRFSRLVVNFFAIGLLRTILFAAIKANALGKSIGWTIQGFGQNVFQTLPVIPYGGWGERVGLGAAYEVLKNRPQELEYKRTNRELDKAKKFFDQNEENEKKTLNDTQIEWIVQNIKNAGGNATTAQTNIQRYLDEQKITTPLNEVASANASLFYQEINTANYDTDRSTMLKAIPTEFRQQYNTLAKTDLETNVIKDNIKENTPEADIPALLTNNKKYLDNYFNSAAANETSVTFKLSDKKQVTITYDPSSATTPYTGVISDIPTATNTNTPAPTPNNTNNNQ